MKILNLTKAFASLALVGMLFSSCDKKEEVDPIGDRGQTLIKILGGGKDELRTGNANDSLTAGNGLKALAIDFVNTPQRIVVLDIRRDVPNNAELMKEMTVTIVEDTALVRVAGYGRLDPSWYTLAPTPGVTKTGGEGGTYTITFAPGEFAKQIEIIINDATVLDPSLNYGLGFRILNVTQGNITVNNSLVTTIGAKNKYDGRYNLRGLHNRPPYNDFPYETEIHMVTTGASSVRFYWPAAGDFGHPIGTATGLSWYGPAIGPEVVFDPSTDLVTSVFNAGGATPIVLYTDPTGQLVSRYDAATKTMYLYFYYFTAAGQDFSNRGWRDTLTYLGPR